MGALWFVEFSLVWTGFVTLIASILTMGRTSAKFGHTVWRCAAFLFVLPWVMVAAKAFAPAPMTAPIPDLPYVDGTADMLAGLPGFQTSTSSETGLTLGWIILGILVAGWAFRLAVTLISQVRLQTLKRDSQPAPAHLTTHKWATALGLKSAPLVRLIPEGTPFLAGLKHRTVFLPESLQSGTCPDMIFAHECTHISRGDLLTRPFERFICDLFWFSPFAWIARRQQDYWREAACDETTAILTGDSVGYARALAQTARLVKEPPMASLPVAAFILPRRRTLALRLNQLLDTEKPHSRTGLAAMAAVFGLLLAPLAMAQTSFALKTPFSHPVMMADDARITSPFGERKDPFKNKIIDHKGLDIGAKKDTLIYAPADATVLRAEMKEGYGKTVDILLKDGRKMRFSQLSYMKVKKGDKIKAGTIVGKLGMSGRATGPHLHLEVWDEGKVVDPSTVKGLVIFEGCCPEGD